jgi:ABC-2 type transport system ATP-binding protein
VNIIETSGLGRRYGGTWALRECAVSIPEGHLVALVGPNGAGKTTLLNLVVGLTAPTVGELWVLGGLVPGSLAALSGIGFVAQDMPLYGHLSVADMLHLTRNLNQHFDDAYARRRLAEFGIPERQRSGRLSGGQQAQLALTLALARHPRLLVLDEPTSRLDPLARHDFMATVMAAMAEDGVSVVLSSHMLAELERVADYLVLISNGRVRLDGPVEQILARHRLITGPADRLAHAGSAGGRGWDVIEASAASSQAHALVRLDTASTPLPPDCEFRPVGIEELTLAYLRDSAAPVASSPTGVSR